MQLLGEEWKNTINTESFTGAVIVKKKVMRADR